MMIPRISLWNISGIMMDGCIQQHAEDIGDIYMSMNRDDTRI